MTDILLIIVLLISAIMKKGTLEINNVVFTGYKKVIILWVVYIVVTYWCVLFPAHWVLYKLGV